jgi:hypothetical protein
MTQIWLIFSILRIYHLSSFWSTWAIGADQSMRASFCIRIVCPCWSDFRIRNSVILSRTVDFRIFYRNSRVFIGSTIVGIAKAKQQKLPLRRQMQTPQQWKMDKLHLQNRISRCSERIVDDVRRSMGFSWSTSVSVRSTCFDAFTRPCQTHPVRESV